ncbi:hypothetical protein BaRGS_00038787, partial [Batillaria attramentaria]
PLRLAVQPRDYPQSAHPQTLNACKRFRVSMRVRAGLRASTSASARAAMIGPRALNGCPV